MITKDDLKWWFMYHPANEQDKQAHEAIRAAGLAMAEVVLKHAPQSADATTALRTIREAVMWANAAIACEGR